MESRCQEDRYGCKYSGDLFDICPEYCQGATENGQPIIQRKDFPLRCKECKTRDFDFCIRFNDLICFNGQDPFNCKADLQNDKFHGIELMKKRDKTAKDAFLKRDLPYNKLCI
jgi:hypothetical protein